MNHFCHWHDELDLNFWPRFSLKCPVLPVNSVLSFVSLVPQVSSLMLYVEEAHKLPVKYFTNPYCNIYLNSVQVAKTHPREGQNPVFTEEFIFEWVRHTSARPLSARLVCAAKPKKKKKLLSLSATCRVKSTDLRSAWATKQKRAKRATSVRTRLPSAVKPLLPPDLTRPLSPRQCSCAASWTVSRRDRWLTSGSLSALTCLWRASSRARCASAPGTPWRRSCPRRSTANSKRSARCRIVFIDPPVKPRWQRLCFCFLHPPDDLAERVPRDLRSGPCLWSRPHLIGQPPPEDLQAREGWSPSTQDPQRQGNKHGR